jgi:peptide/nickel transport system substrate-binding protein
LFLVLLGVAQSAFAQAAPYIKSFYSLPLTLDPIKMNDTASLAVSNLIYDGLLKFSPKLELEPAVAESWTTSSDGKRITFKLRPNATFHDGSQITSDDVKFSLVRVLSSSSRVRKLYDCIEGADEIGGVNKLNQLGIETPDKKTVIIKLKAPFPPFLSVLAGATAKILPKALLTNKDFFTHPIGSGAFRYNERRTEQKRIFLEAFDGHYSGPPRIRELILEEHTEAQALELAKSGRVHDLANWPLANTTTDECLGVDEVV